MQELEITWPRVASFFWLWIWRGALGGGLISGILGAILRLTTLPPLLVAAALFVIGMGWQLIVVRMALRKKYRDFRLAFVPNPTT
ncbi:MAG: hypothetical protein ACLQME_20345 [Alphaproteobacteria bacterium]